MVHDGKTKPYVILPVRHQWSTLHFHLTADGSAPPASGSPSAPRVTVPAGPRLPSTVAPVALHNAIILCMSLGVKLRRQERSVSSESIEELRHMQERLNRNQYKHTRSWRRSSAALSSPVWDVLLACLRSRMYWIPIDRSTDPPQVASMMLSIAHIHRPQSTSQGGTQGTETMMAQSPTLCNTKTVSHAKIQHPPWLPWNTCLNCVKLSSPSNSSFIRASMSINYKSTQHAVTTWRGDASKRRRLRTTRRTTVEKPDFTK